MNEGLAYKHPDRDKDQFLCRLPLSCTGDDESAQADP